MDNDNKVICDDIQIMFTKLSGLICFQVDNKREKLISDTMLIASMFIVLNNNYYLGFIVDHEQKFDLENEFIEIENKFLDAFYTDDCEFSINQKILCLDDDTLDKYIKHLITGLEGLLDDMKNHYNYN